MRVSGAGGFPSDRALEVPEDLAIGAIVNTVGNLTFGVADEPGLRRVDERATTPSGILAGERTVVLVVVLVHLIIAMLAPVLLPDVDDASACKIARDDGEGDHQGEEPECSH